MILLQITRALRGQQKNIRRFPFNYALVKRYESSELQEEKKPETLGGFAKAFIKHSHIKEPQDTDVPFATLLRNSKLIDLGDPEGRIVEGTIFHVVEDDLYIDFGWKFHCVCRRPTTRGSEYICGSKVRLRIKELELSTKFLGSEKELTILEANAHLLGLIETPTKTR